MRKKTKNQIGLLRLQSDKILCILSDATEAKQRFYRVCCWPFKPYLCENCCCFSEITT